MARKGETRKEEDDGQREAVHEITSIGA
jgi:hypothetical protein